jgi:hypothetical protein
LDGTFHAQLPSGYYACPTIMIARSYTSRKPTAPCLFGHLKLYSLACSCCKILAASLHLSALEFLARISSQKDVRDILVCLGL